MKLRRIREIDTLEKVIDKKNHELSDSELAVFWGASDHRLAEIIMGRIYDHIPPSIWRHVE